MRDLPNRSLSGFLTALIILIVLYIVGSYWYGKYAIDSTQQRFDEIKLGTSPTNVRGIIGEPDEIWSCGKRPLWVYHSPDVDYWLIHFDQSGNLIAKKHMKPDVSGPNSLRPVPIPGYAFYYAQKFFDRHSFEDSGCISYIDDLRDP